ncbi:PepSY domain-containing protein [Paenibacillus alvei]|nr:PepSY domain-containing protein [Paenibacillus alvei]MCY9580354.1 PepSY domain-containing protein [Paenibacillus alvei]MCY9583320.1 PepSY domain-containing protein [Paenibacillus alvei]
MKKAIFLITLMTALGVYTACADATSSKVSGTEPSTPAAPSNGVSNPPAAQNQTRAISEEEAKKIALQQVSGKVIHIDLDSDNGMLKYEVIVMTDQGKVYEVEIDAGTGKVLKVEQEDQS